MKQQELADVESKIQRLQIQYDGAVNNLQTLQSNMALAEARLGRSGRLTSALGDEKIRWENSIKVLSIIYYYTIIKSPTIQ